MATATLTRLFGGRTEEEIKHLFLRRKDRRIRGNETAFAALVATPHVFDAIAATETTATNLALPANIRLALSHGVAVSAGDITVNVGPNRAFSHPDLVADQISRGEWGEEAWEISITRGPAAIAGTFTLYYVSAFGLHVAIATATFS